MKTQCEKCRASLPGLDLAYICAYECTFCPDCTEEMHNICPHCTGELVRRPRPAYSIVARKDVSAAFKVRPSLVWAASAAIWILISIAATLTIYQMYRMMGESKQLREIATMEFCQMLSFLPLTPFAFGLALRYPIQRGNWLKPILVHAGAALVFTLGHVVVRGFTPYGYWDPKHLAWTYTFWDSYTHSWRFSLSLLNRIYLGNVVDDVSSAYLPITLVGHAILYYQRLQEKEIRATQLEGQLAKTRLQMLKNQMQPHFLFNTLHSISALMLTNVTAADRMMTSLSDLLRMSLEDNGNQLTTLSREVEFLDVYLDIEKARFEDRLSVFFEIEPEALDAQVPHLLLQPLVENAIRHGLSKCSRTGKIEIVAKRERDYLAVWIRDNGAGFLEPPEELFKQGLGLSIARERLETLYADKQRCEIRSIADGGAEVHLRMPFVAPARDIESNLLIHRSV